MQACLKMISTHFSKSLSEAERSKMFFSRTITHIFKLHPCPSRREIAKFQGTFAAVSAERQLVKARGKMGMAQVYRNLSYSLRKKLKSSDLSLSVGQSGGNCATAEKTLKNTASMICPSFPERRGDLLARRAFSPACISLSTVFFSKILQQSSFFPRFTYQLRISPKDSANCCLRGSSLAAESCVWYLASCSLRQNSNSQAMLARMSWSCRVSGTSSTNMWWASRALRYCSLKVNLESRYLWDRESAPTSRLVIASNCELKLSKNWAYSMAVAMSC